LLLVDAVYIQTLQNYIVMDAKKLFSIINNDKF
jgi:hypothetical protein